MDSELSRRGSDLMCETEVLLSLDGGRTIYMRLTESAQSERAIFRLDRPERAHKRSGAGYSLRASEYLPGNTQAFRFNLLL